MDASLQSVINDAQHALLTDIADRIMALDYTALNLDERLQALFWLTVCDEREQAIQLAHDLWDAELSPAQQGKVYAAIVRCGADTAAYSLSPPGVLMPRWVSMQRKLGMEHVYPTEIREIAFSFEHQNEVCVHFTLQCLACQSIIHTDKKSNFLPYRAQKAGQWMCPHCLALSAYDPAKVRQRVFSLYDAYFQNLPRDVKGFLSESDACLAMVIAAGLRPFGLIRFLNVYSSKIGHYIFNTAFYYSRRLMGQDEASLDYIGLNPRAPVINATVTEMWQRLLPLSPAAGQIASLHAASEHTFTLLQCVDVYNAVERYPVIFPFTCKENMDAHTHMEKMGIPRGSKFVCWFCRTENFVKHHFSAVQADEHQSYRNAPLETFRKAIDYLLSKGYYVLRMGTDLNPPIPWQAENLIDYAKEYHTEFMDVWLFSHADLTISTGSGPDGIPVVAGRNILYASIAPIGYALSCSSKTTHLFEHYYSNKVHRRMTLKEIFASGFSTNQLESEFEKNGFSLEKSTEDEILAAVQEKVFVMEGGRRSNEDLQLQRAFERLYDIYKSLLVDYYSPPPLRGTPLHGPKYFAQVSSVFLRQYRDELLAIR